MVAERVIKNKGSNTSFCLDPKTALGGAIVNNFWYPHLPDLLLCFFQSSLDGTLVAPSGHTSHLFSRKVYDLKVRLLEVAAGFL